MAFRPRSAKQAAQPLLVEIEVYLHLLTLIYLLDSKQMGKAVACTKLLMARLLPLNRRSLDMLAAKCHFYHSRVYELTDNLDSIRGSVGDLVGRDVSVCGWVGGWVGSGGCEVISANPCLMQ